MLAPVFLWLRFDLANPVTLYEIAAAALLVRLCLFFELGDQYGFSSIRTAPGMVLSGGGLPLGTVVAVLLFKYALPWLLIFAVFLPSLVERPAGVTTHLLDLCALGYVARFALVAAVIDPCRILPNGMDGIVAELVTFTIACMIGLLLVSRGGETQPIANTA